VNPDDITVSVQKVDEAEVDEMGSFMGPKQAPRWLWRAIDHCTGAVLAYVFGRRQNEVFLELKRLLEPFGITRYYTDRWGAYVRHLAPEGHCPGKHDTPTSSANLSYCVHASSGRCAGRSAFRNLLSRTMSSSACSLIATKLERPFTSENPDL
jgi:IS1 family transposase